MWWYFRKLYEDDLIVCYAYAEESRETDGELEYNKRDETVNITKPSVTTPGDVSRRRTREKVYSLRLMGFPDKQMIACG